MNKGATQSRIKELITYDKNTGVVIVNKTKKAITKTHYGYLRFQVDGIRYKLHRLIWLYVYGEMPKYFIDHINGDRSDNRIKNLRDVTNSVNCLNKRKARSDSSSKVIGVYPRSKGKGYWTSIQYNGKRKYLGTFKTKEEAYKVYISEKQKAQGFT